MPEAALAVTHKPEPSATLVEDPAWKHVLGLPCDLTVDLQVPGFTLGQLAEMESDSVIDAHWNVTEDIPIRVNGELVAWSEFEVVGNKLAVRLTELA